MGRREDLVVRDVSDVVDATNQQREEIAISHSQLDHHYNKLVCSLGEVQQRRFWTG
jgi:hypothetical protein